MRKDKSSLFIIFFLVFIILLISVLGQNDATKASGRKIVFNALKNDSTNNNHNNNFEKEVLKDVEFKKIKGINLKNISSKEKKIRNNSVNLKKYIQTINGIEVYGSSNIYLGSFSNTLEIKKKLYNTNKAKSAKNKFDVKKNKKELFKEEAKVISKKLVYYPLEKNGSTDLVLSYIMKVKDSDGSWSYIINEEGDVLKKTSEIMHDNYGNVVGDISQKYPTDEKEKVNLSNLFIQFYNASNNNFYAKIGDEEEATLETLDEINLSNASKVNLSYSIKYDIEYGWDFVYVEIKENDTADWTQLEADNMTYYQEIDSIGLPGKKAYTGSVDYFVNENIDLSQYINKSIKIRFRYQTDTFVTGSGLYLSNIQIDSDSSNLFYDSALNFSSWNNSLFLIKKEYNFIDNATTDINGFFNKTSIDANETVIEFKGEYASVRSDKFEDTFFETLLSDSLNIIDFSAFDNSDNFTKTNAYYHINLIHDFLKNELNLSYMDYQMTVTTEVDNVSYCNAYYDSITEDTYFGMGDTDENCSNLALASDVIYHEYTHGLVDHIYSDGSLPYENEPGAINEGLADFFAFILTNDTQIGEVTFGYSLRDINNTFRYPEDIVYEVHDDSRIFSGALFDMQNRIGRNYSLDLIILSMEAESNNFTNFLSNLILFDDDNNNLDDGTPYMFEVCDAFYNNHGIDSDNCIKKPLFNKTYPFESNIIINETEGINFSIDYKDFDDSDVRIDWYLDSSLINNSNASDYSFFTNYSSAKNYTIKAIISDNSSNSTHSWNVSVLNVNRLPVAEDLQVITAELTDQISFNVSATDPDNENLSYQINDSRFININNSFFWNTTYLDKGNFTFALNISDGLSYAMKNLSVNVIDTIYPLWDNNENITSEYSFPVDFFINATDPKGIPLTYSINDTDNFFINFTTGRVTNKNELDVNVYYLSINASDGTNNIFTIIKINVTEYIIQLINSSKVNLTIFGNNDGSINLVWHNETNPKIIRYNVYRKNSTIDAPVNASDLIASNITSLNFLDNSTKSKNTAYYYVLTAIDKFENENLSAITNVVNITTPNECTNDYLCVEWTTCSSGLQSRQCSRTCHLEGELNPTTDVQSCTSSIKNSGGGGGGGASLDATILASTSTTLSEMKSEKLSIITVDNTKSVALYEATINVNETLYNIKITFAKVDTMPTDTKSPEETERVFKYLQITLSSGKDKIRQSNLKFKVEKDWINSNNITKEDIRLFRHTTQWDELKTTITKEDETYVYYEAITPGFSYFKISATKSPIEKETIAKTLPNIIDDTSQNHIPETLNNEIPKDAMAKSPYEDIPAKNLNFKKSNFIYLILSIIITAGLMISLIKHKDNIPKLHDKNPLMLLEDYILNCKNQKVGIEAIKQRLLGHGWKEEIINKAMHDLKMK